MKGLFIKIAQATSTKRRYLMKEMDSTRFQLMKMSLHLLIKQTKSNSNLWILAPRALAQHCRPANRSEQQAPDQRRRLHSG